jgi:hypothetical protein
MPSLRQPAHLVEEGRLSVSGSQRQAVHEALTIQTLLRKSQAFRVTQLKRHARANMGRQVSCCGQEFERDHPRDQGDRVDRTARSFISPRSPIAAMIFT